MKLKLLMIVLLTSGLSLLVMSRQSSSPKDFAEATAPAALSSIKESSPQVAVQAESVASSHLVAVEQPTSLVGKIADLKKRIRQEDVINRLNGRSLAPEIRRQYFGWIDELTKAETEQINQEIARLEIEIHSKRKTN